MIDEEYISKEEALKKGYRRRRGGGLYKPSVLEKYLENGDLELQNSPFSAEDRKRAGEHLAKDFYLGNYNNGRDDALIYKEAYLNAIKRIPNEFWPAVRIVCIEDKELKADKNIIPHSLRSKQIVFHLKSLLVLGLERLVKYYLQKNEKSA